MRDRDLTFDELPIGREYRHPTEGFIKNHLHKRIYLKEIRNYIQKNYYSLSPRVKHVQYPDMYDRFFKLDHILHYIYLLNLNGFMIKYKIEIGYLDYDNDSYKKTKPMLYHIIVLGTQETKFRGNVKCPLEEWLFSVCKRLGYL